MDIITSVTLDEKKFLGFLSTVESNKIGYAVASTAAIENIAAFIKAGWKLTGTFKNYSITCHDGLIFERD